MSIEELYKHFLQYPRAVKDTREEVKDAIYFSLKGANFDGNKYAGYALELGAAFAVIDDPDQYKDERTILVDDALKCLQDLSTFHRRQLGIPIVSLTGSNGKTTTKELIYAVLSQKYNCFATKGNLNNHIGVPLTLLAMTKEVEIGVVEMGANHPGEIAALCEIAMPDYGYITNFGRVHLEGFGSLQGVIEGKTEMYRHLKKNNKEVFINASDQVQMERSQGMKRHLFGRDIEGCSCEMIGSDPFVSMRFGNTDIHSELLGAYNFSNMAAAACIGSHFEVTQEQIKMGIESYVPENNRSQVLYRGNTRVILDAYNANPNSMEAALDSLENLQALNKVAILGDMFELGPDSAKEHQGIVERLEKLPGIGEVYLVGKRFMETKETLDKIAKFESFEDFAQYLEHHDFSDCTVLIKASRGMALERVVDLL